MLPLWAVEYDFLGQPFRAFVSALTDATPTPAVSGVQHHPPWVLPAALTGGALAGGALGASAFGGGLMLAGGGAAVGSAAAMAGAYADAMLQFRKWCQEGELRRREEGANVKWKVLIPPSRTRRSEEMKHPETRMRGGPHECTRRVQVHALFMHGFRV